MTRPPERWTAGRCSREWTVDRGCTIGYTDPNDNPVTSEDKTMPQEPARAALNDVAAVLKVHPRTVLRAVENDVNAYWTEDYNPTVDLDAVDAAFSTDIRKFMRRIKRGSDELLSRMEALTAVNEAASPDKRIRARTFRARKYPAAVRRGNVVRYSRYDVINYTLEHFETDW